MSYNKRQLTYDARFSNKAISKPNPYKHDVLYTPRGQYDYPGQVTKIPSNNITMKGVPYPVLGIDDYGHSQLMLPEQDYMFPGNTVTEYPILQQGGIHIEDPVVKGVYDIDHFNKQYTKSKNFQRMAKRADDNLYQDRLNTVNAFNPRTDIIRDDNIPTQMGYLTPEENFPIMFLNSDKGDWPDYELINAHEFGHVPYTENSLAMTPWQIDNIKKRNYEQYKLNQGVYADASEEEFENIMHDIDPQETRADLFQLRYQLYKDGIYDSTKNKKFRKRHLDEYRKREEEGSSHWNRLLRLYNDRDIIWLMNNIAQNTNKQTELDYAQHGGEKEPIYVSNKNDSRYQAYQDSLNLYENSVIGNTLTRSYNIHDYQFPYYHGLNERNTDYRTSMLYTDPGIFNTPYLGNINNIVRRTGYQPIGMDYRNLDFPIFKKPTQSVEVLPPPKPMETKKPSGLSNLSLGTKDKYVPDDLYIGSGQGFMNIAVHPNELNLGDKKGWFGISRAEQKALEDIGLGEGYYKYNTDMVDSDMLMNYVRKDIEDNPDYYEPYTDEFSHIIKTKNYNPIDRDRKQKGGEKTKRSIKTPEQLWLDYQNQLYSQTTTPASSTKVATLPLGYAKPVEETKSVTGPQGQTFLSSDDRTEHEREMSKGWMDDVLNPSLYRRAMEHATGAIRMFGDPIGTGFDILRGENRITEREIEHRKKQANPWISNEERFWNSVGEGASVGGWAATTALPIPYAKDIGKSMLRYGRHVPILNKLIQNMGFRTTSGGKEMLKSTYRPWMSESIKKTGKAISPSVDDGKGFKSEIDWAKWNKEIPENKVLMQEYNAIEQHAKANGTWMKNPDGSAFKGTPEQFVQQNSENFKKAFGSSKLVNPDGSPIILFHGSKNKFDIFDIGKANTTDIGMSGTGIYTSPIKDNAIRVNNNHLYTLYGKSENPIRSSDLIKDKKYWTEYQEALFNFYRKGKSIPKEQRLTKYDAGIADEWIDVPGKRTISKAHEIIFPDNKQLKSAIGNSGMFDLTNPNIYKSVTGVTAGGAAAGIGIPLWDKMQTEQ
jgi:hypothetical protein